MISPAERNERTDGPIHGWFGLTYSNYLVLHRSMMQSMPVAWQERAVALFDEMDNAFPDLERPPSFIVTAAAETEYSELSRADLKDLGIVYRPTTCRYYDRDGVEHEPWERALVPLPGGDPVPHYNRGRTFVEPTENGGNRWRLAEFATLPDECFIAACDGEPDPRGPVWLRSGAIAKACPGHWEGVMLVLGEQASWERTDGAHAVLLTDATAEPCCTEAEGTATRE